MNDERKTSFEDELIDRAFEHRRVGEPRPGLEERVLARLEAAGEARRGWVFKMGAIAVPAALVVVAAVYTFRSPELQAPVDAKEPRIVQAAPPTATAAEEATSASLAPPASPVVVPEPRASVPTAETAALSADTFPSRRALSPQEAMLVRFVRSAAPEILHQVAERAPGQPLRIEELSSEPLHFEPLHAADPLTAS